MSFFSSAKKTERFGVIVDIGSGSALAAIIHSDENELSPTIVWYAREHAPLKNIDSTSESAKAVTTALMNALLRLDSEGRKVLAAYRANAKITDFQCTISAPWSYTVTKNINYTQEEPFEITKELVEELVRTAQEKTTDELNESEVAAQLDLQIVARTTMSLLANGYRIKSPEGEKSPSLSLVHASAVTQQYLVDSLEDLRQKLLPEAEMRMMSYILVMFCVSKDLFPNLQEVCLVDVTYEATEVGIVRDGSLQYSTHTSFGLFSLAREIAAVTKSPLYEAFKYLHGNTPYAFIDSVTASQKADIELIFEAYINRLADLLKETGDELSIPKQMIINTDAQSETLMKDLLEKATKRAIKSNPAIQMVATKLTAKNDTTEEKQAIDTAMLIAARFFHKREHCLTFEYL